MQQINLQTVSISPDLGHTDSSFNRLRCSGRQGIGTCNRATAAVTTAAAIAEVKSVATLAATAALKSSDNKRSGNSRRGNIIGKAAATTETTSVATVNCYISAKMSFPVM